MSITRRELLGKSAQFMAFYALYRHIDISNAWGSEIKPIVQQWCRDVMDLCNSVKERKLTALEWQTSIERLHTRIPLEEILKFTDLHKVVKSINHPSQKLGAIHNVPWPRVEGYSDSLVFGHKLFIYRKGACTPPHAHNNLVSAHLILSGEIHVRTFDRIKDLDKAMLIKEVRDEKSRPGSCVTMSDLRENVHWFEALKNNSVSFDIPVSDIDTYGEFKIPAEGQNQIFVDPKQGIRQANGLLEAPVIKFAESVKRYAL